MRKTIKYLSTIPSILLFSSYQLVAAMDAFDLTGTFGDRESLRRASIPAHVMVMQPYVIAASYGGVKVFLMNPIQPTIAWLPEAKRDFSQVSHNNISTTHFVASSSPLQKSSNQSAPELDILHEQMKMFHKLKELRNNPKKRSRTSVPDDEAASSRSKTS